MFRRQIGMAVVALVVAGIVGCGPGGPKLVPAKGKVTYKGEPLAGASVTFIHQDGQIAVGSTSDSGEFSLVTVGEPGAMVGQHKVGIRKSASVEGMPANPKPEDMFKMAAKKATPLGQTVVPTKYESPDDSGLTATVSDDETKNNFTFDLVD